MPTAIGVPAVLVAIVIGVTVLEPLLVDVGGLAVRGDGDAVGVGADGDGGAGGVGGELDRCDGVRAEVGDVGGLAVRGDGDAVGFVPTVMGVPAVLPETVMGVTLFEP